MKIIYPALGLAGEAGEVADKVKKIVRGLVILMEMKRDIAAEIGDCLWYCAVLANDLGVDLAQIADGDLQKLADHASSGVFCTEAVTSGRVSSTTASFLALGGFFSLLSGGFLCAPLIMASASLAKSGIGTNASGSSSSMMDCTVEAVISKSIAVPRPISLRIHLSNSI